MSIQADVERYFHVIEAGEVPVAWKLELNFLRRAEVEELTQMFQGHPVIDQLNGAVLDDPDTSNHHVLLRRPPLDGQVLYLSHDGDSRIVFSSLSELLAYVGRAEDECVPLPELHPSLSPLAVNQTALSGLIRTLVAEDQIDTALTLVPSMDLSDHALLRELIAHRDFFLGESVARAIQARPSPDLLALATRCAEHSHPQVARAGRGAREACGK